MASGASGHVPSMASKRLQKEISRFPQSLPKQITARPRENNLLEFHYVVRGPENTPFEGGYYHGVIELPSEYPMKAPAIKLFTPSGRFQPSVNICMSITNFHQETWNPAWGIATILTGFMSFMVDEDADGVGRITSDKQTKKKLAKASMEFNKKNPIFRSLFPDIIEESEGKRPPPGDPVHEISVPKTPAEKDTKTNQRAEVGADTAAGESQQATGRKQRGGKAAATSAARKRNKEKEEPTIDLTEDDHDSAAAPVKKARNGKTATTSKRGRAKAAIETTDGEVEILDAKPKRAGRAGRARKA
eukprot:gb/GECG01002112.1/.p1 GENE.gb/GECG01002112.1/~~gb/GECG01002112.1/.p1  ORF type:complete len:303 (+),score=46.94 gb/GECG01002112.1/:1-909(+)